MTEQGAERLTEVLPRGQLPGATVARWGANLANQLATAHADGRLHGDVRAGAVTITADGRARLDGFGERDAFRPPEHPAPEPDSTPSAAADVYALGALLHRAGGGAVPRLAELWNRMGDADPARRPSAQQVAERLRRLDPARRHNRLVAAVAAVAVLAVLAVTAIALWPHLTGRTAPNAIGDPRTADPCALLDAKAMHRFGATRVYPDEGVPSSCTLFIQPNTGSGALLEVSVSEPFTEDHDLTRLSGQRIGTVTVYAEPTPAGRCHRTVLLPDRFRIYLHVDGSTTNSPDLCAVADAGVEVAIKALGTSSLPRRAVVGPANSVVWLHACNLGDEAALRGLAGVKADLRQPNLGGWACEWGNDPAVADPSFVAMYLMRGRPLSGQTSVIGGHTATTTPDPQGACVVELAQRYYQGAYDLPRVEKLHVTVHLAGAPIVAQCAAATKIAEAAAAKLPPPG